MAAFNAFFAQLTGGGGHPPGAGADDSGTVVPTTSPSGRPAPTGARAGGGAPVGGSGGFGVRLRGRCVSYNPVNDRELFGTPQCEAVANLPESSRRRGLCGQGAMMAANQSFLCYTIKTLIRVIHRAKGARALLKISQSPAEGDPQDMCLCANNPELLALVTSEGDLLVWRLSLSPDYREDAPSQGVGVGTGSGAGGGAGTAGTGEVLTENWLCVRGGHAQGVAWHPLGSRYLAVICGRKVVLCDMFKCSGSKGQGSGAPGEDFPLLAAEDGRVPGSVCLGHAWQVNDCSFSTGGSLMATAGKDGLVMLWDTRLVGADGMEHNLPTHLTPLSSFRAGSDGGPLWRVLVTGLKGGDDENYGPQAIIVTGEDANHLIKVWKAPASPSASGPPGVEQRVLKPEQTVCLEGSGPGVALSLEADPKGQLIMVADTGEGLLYALHLADGGSSGGRFCRMDYLRPYSLAHPVLSFVVLEEETQPEFGYEGLESNPSQGRGLQLVCVQTKPVQIYRIEVADATPSWTGDEEDDDEEEEEGEGGEECQGRVEVEAEEEEDEEDSEVGRVGDEQEGVGEGDSLGRGVESLEAGGKSEEMEEGEEEEDGVQGGVRGRLSMEVARELEQQQQHRAKEEDEVFEDEDAGSTINNASSSRGDALSRQDSRGSDDTDDVDVRMHPTNNYSAAVAAIEAGAGSGRRGGVGTSDETDTETASGVGSGGGGGLEGEVSSRILPEGWEEAEADDWEHESGVSAQSMHRSSPPQSRLSGGIGEHKGSLGPHGSPSHPTIPVAVAPIHAPTATSAPPPGGGHQQPTLAGVEDLLPLLTPQALVAASNNSGSGREAGNSAGGQGTEGWTGTGSMASSGAGAGSGEGASGARDVDGDEQLGWGGVRGLEGSIEAMIHYGEG
ncbi:unnamed protein product, partial [Choristocarpus tenellus]